MLAVTLIDDEKYCVGPAEENVYFSRMFSSPMAGYIGRSNSVAQPLQSIEMYGPLKLLSTEDAMHQFFDNIPARLYISHSVREVVSTKINAIKAALRMVSLKAELSTGFELYRDSLFPHRARVLSQTTRSRYRQMIHNYSFARAIVVLTSEIVSLELYLYGFETSDELSALTAKLERIDIILAEANKMVDLHFLCAPGTDS